jgi:hypothetical protein
MAGFMTWWLPELGACAGLTTAGVFGWWPLDLAAVVPLVRPALDALDQVRFAQLERMARCLETASAGDERYEPRSLPVSATATRLDQANELEDRGGDEQ